MSGRRLVDLLCSMKLTIGCLITALVLVFIGTLAQVHYGTHLVQERFFQSTFVWWPMESGRGVGIPIFPGGHLIGGLMLLNLVAAHLRRFRLNWRHFGIHLIHGGLIVMLAGGLFADLFAVESFIRLAPGDALNYSQHPSDVELAAISEKDPEFDQVTAIPERRLSRGGVIEHRSLPFRIVVEHFYRNARLEMAGQNGGKPAADQGVGARIAVTELPRATAMDERDMKAAVIRIEPLPQAGQAAPKPLGTWLVSEALGAPQRFTCAGGSWRIALRLQRFYKPYTLTLQRFTHETYAGTDIPKNFASRVTLIDPERAVKRTVLIYMNHPLRYRGETFYQSGFEKGDQATILQTVHNPTFVAPYIGCVVIAAGLIFQFAQHFVRFSRGRKAASAQ